MCSGISHNTDSKAAHGKRIPGFPKKAMMIAKAVVGTIAAFLLSLAVGCGGGGGGGGSSSTASSAATSTITGVAANGAAMAGTIYVKDANGTEQSATIGDQGSYTIAVDGLKAPFMLKAVAADNSVIRYSFALANGTVNINPLTYVAVAGAAGTTDLDAFYRSAYVSQLASLTSGFNDYVAAVKSQLSALFTNFNVSDTDFLSGKIQIGKGMDGVFDFVKVSVTANGISMYATDPAKPFLTMTRSGSQMTLTSNTGNMPSATPIATFNMAQTLSDVAQRTTLAFDGVGIMTGNLNAQSFFPPGKVADYTGFQYLRDNDPDNMGHNTSFLTRVANNVIYILNDAQLAQLKTLASAQIDQSNLYGYKRYALMQAFRRLLDGDIPAGAAGLNLNAVKKASRELYLIDGQIAFDRALLYARIFSSMDATQRAYLDAMKGKGWSSWPDIPDAQVRSKMQGLPQGTAVAVMTYAGDIYSWYAGSLDADVYFCPERHGTYYGGFYIKDAPAVGHEGYSISEQLTATTGTALIDSSKGYVTPAQATLIASLVDTQRNNLYASATANIVQTRTAIATLLRSLLSNPSSTDSIKSQVLQLSGVYGDLDGENNYNYATIFAQVYKTFTAAQKAKLMVLRQSILSGSYADGTAYDFTTATTPYLYSDVITNLSLLTPYIGNTDYLFFEP